jgi:hypothetical protein
MGRSPTLRHSTKAAECLNYASVDVMLWLPEHLVAAVVRDKQHVGQGGRARAVVYCTEELVT